MKNIVLSNICKQHKKKNILENITFKAKEGRITAFLGPNGAGKSSTLTVKKSIVISSFHYKLSDRHLMGLAELHQEKLKHI